MKILVDGNAVISAEVCNNRDFAEIHSRVRMPVLYLSAGTGRTTQADDFHKCLLEINGVDDANSYRPYRLSIEKADLFSWNEILPEVLRTINDFLKLNGELVTTVLPESYDRNTRYTCNDQE